MTTTQNDIQDSPDLDVIDPEVGFVIVDGEKCRVNRLKTREFLMLMRVLTSGLGPGLSTVRLDFTDGETVARDLSALMLLAVPNATEEFANFLGQITKPTNPEKNAQVARYLHDNPELDVMLDIFETVAVQEKDDLAALAGKAQAMWSRIASLYGAGAGPK